MVSSSSGGQVLKTGPRDNRSERIFNRGGTDIVGGEVNYHEAGHLMRSSSFDGESPSMT